MVLSIGMPVGLVSLVSRSLVIVCILAFGLPDGFSVQAEQQLTNGDT